MRYLNLVVNFVVEEEWDIEHHHPAPIVWFPVATIPDIREEVEVIQDPSVLDPLRIAVIQEEDRGPIHVGVPQTIKEIDEDQGLVHFIKVESDGKSPSRGQDWGHGQGQGQAQLHGQRKYKRSQSLCRSSMESGWPLKGLDQKVHQERGRENKRLEADGGEDLVPEVAHSNSINFFIPMLGNQAHKKLIHQRGYILAENGT